MTNPDSPDELEPIVNRYEITLRVDAEVIKAADIKPEREESEVE